MLGHLNDFFPTIEKRVRELGLGNQVRFLGFVTPLDLQCLYKLSRCMTFPTKFEGWGMPLLEAHFGRRTDRLLECDVSARTRG